MSAGRSVDAEAVTRLAGQQATPRPVGGFAASPAFDTSAVPDARAAFDEIVLDQLVWPGSRRPSFDECCEIVRDYADIL